MLSALFSRCVHRAYVQTPNRVDYAVDRIGSHLSIYFQASDGLADWMSNLNFPPAAYRRDGGVAWYAHGGFLRAWESIADRIHSWIMDASVRRVTVVGYSHGAALAVFCHEHIWYHRPDLRDSLNGYGFASPRVLWGCYSASLMTRWDRFTVIRNREDIVTHMPPWFLGYRHVGELLEIGERGKYSVIDAHRPENIRRELWRYEKGYAFDYKNLQKPLTKRDFRAIIHPSNR